MNLISIGFHPDFPESIWVVVEQPSNEPIRIEYDPGQNVLRQTEYQSLMYVRGFRGAYGWIGGLGTPPDPHSDVILVSDRNHKSENFIPAHVCGIFFRNDEDHKVVAIDAEMRKAIPKIDLFRFDEDIYNEVINIYPEVAENEGWRGAQEAIAYLQKKFRIVQQDGGEC